MNSGDIDVDMDRTDAKEAEKSTEMYSTESGNENGTRLEAGSRDMDGDHECTGTQNNILYAGDWKDKYQESCSGSSNGKEPSPCVIPEDVYGSACEDLVLSIFRKSEEEIGLLQDGGIPARTGKFLTSVFTRFSQGYPELLFKTTAFQRHMEEHECRTCHIVGSKLDARLEQGIQDATKWQVARDKERHERDSEIETQLEAFRETIRQHELRLQEYELKMRETHQSLMFFHESSQRALQDMKDMKRQGEDGYQQPHYPRNEGRLPSIFEALGSIDSITSGSFASYKDS